MENVEVRLGRCGWIEGMDACEGGELRRTDVEGSHVGSQLLIVQGRRQLLQAADEQLRVDFVVPRNHGRGG